MLQQTRVEVVIERFESFMKRFPDPAALAAATEDDVLTEWSGLGYYRRARMLHAAARELVARGGFPRSVAALRELPGVGAYTAAAVASICWNEPVAAIDGNVERVIARLVALDENPKRAVGRRVIEEVATGLLDRNRSGDSVQAMMELGATICRPKKARCGRCPLKEDCRAFEIGAVDHFPLRPPRAEPELVRRVVALVRDKNGRYLLARERAARGGRQKGVAAGMWELPNVEVAAERLWPSEETAERLARRVGGKFSFCVVGRSEGSETIRRLPEARHSITNHKITYEICTAVWSADRTTGGSDVAEVPYEAVWASEEDLASLPLAAMVGKCLAAATTVGPKPVDLSRQDLSR